MRLGLLFKQWNLFHRTSGDLRRNGDTGKRGKKMTGCCHPI
jgi:hypothetical protein